MYTNSPRCCDCNTTTSLSQILPPNSTFRGVVGGADVWLVVVAFGAGYRNRTDDIFLLPTGDCLRVRLNAWFAATFPSAVSPMRSMRNLGTVLLSFQRFAVVTIMAQKLAFVKLWHKTIPGPTFCHDGCCDLYFFDRWIYMVELQTVRRPALDALVSQVRESLCHSFGGVSLSVFGLIVHKSLRRESNPIFLLTRQAHRHLCFEGMEPVLYLTELNRRGLSEAVICGIVLQSQEQRYLHRAPSVAVETDFIAALTSP